MLFSLTLFVYFLLIKNLKYKNKILRICLSILIYYFFNKS